MPTPEPRAPRPAATRYQGSKLKLLPWLWENLKTLDFHTALDAFGGTGAVSYLLKTHGKAVTYNDYLHFNALIGRALLENPGVQLHDAAIEFILTRHPHVVYQDFIAATFQDIYFTEAENIWLDLVGQNIALWTELYQQAIAYYALFQACLIKRPYNLFHRRNLYMRTASVPRNFGNKAAWDRPFEAHFRNFVAEANGAAFDSGVPCRALCGDALDVPGAYDLVYLDPPYINRRGVGTDYLDFYHFLEGLVHYPGWSQRLDHTKKHRPLRGEKSAWSDPQRVQAAFAQLFERYAESILVVSYRSDGVLTEAVLVGLMARLKRQVEVVHYGPYQYALSKNGASQEILIIGR